MAECFGRLKLHFFLEYLAMVRKFLFAVAAVFAFFAVNVTYADTTTYNSALTSPPGFYNGSGGVNNGFTIVNGGNIEIGLRAMLRQNPADIANGSNNIYSVPLGSQTNITSGGNGDNPARAAWNFDFSVDLLSSGLHLNNISTVLTITGIPGSPPGSPLSFDALTMFSDNSGWDTAKNLALSNLDTDIGFQNSENANFVGINIILDATYNFKLDVYNKQTQALIASDNIVVVAGNGGVSAVPLPASVYSGLSTLVLLGGAVLYKKRRVSVGASVV